MWPMHYINTASLMLWDMPVVWIAVQQTPAGSKPLTQHTAAVPRDLAKQSKPTPQMLAICYRHAFTS